MAPCGSAPPPHGHVLSALTREGLAPPAAPAVAQRHPGELRHQVELRRPDVAERHRVLLDRAADGLEVMRDEALAGDVVLVDTPVRLAALEDAERVPGREPPEVGDADLDHEVP